tara:strand:- start:1790 stop:3379 length:1590 start_codon:yes stop_codon:yes gene_type:complete
MSSNISDTMSSGFYVPDSLKFYVNKLSFSKNRVKLQALSSQVANPNGQIIVRLPSNTMLNMASLTMTGSVRASIAAAADNEGVALPTNLDYSFIESISIIANGGVISQPFLNYKLIANVLNDVYGGDEKIDNRAALQGSRPSLLYDYLAISTAPGAASAYVPFSINSWLSPLQSMSPSYINTNLLGDLELRITLTDTSILQSGSTALPAAAFAGAPAGGAAVVGLQARCSYDMKDISFYIETASIQSNILDQAIDAKLRSGEPINIPFENIFSFQQTNNGANFNQRFSVSSQSINKVIAVTQLQTDVVNDGTQKRFINGIPQSLRRNSNGAQQAQFSINNQYSPNYQINSDLNNAFDFGLGTFVAGSARNYQQSSGLIETVAALDTPDYDYESSHHKLCSTTPMPFEMGLNAPNITANVVGITNIPKQGPAPVLTAANNDTYWFPYTYQSPIDTYLYDKYVVATSFDLHCDSSRLISGVNTLGSNSQLFYNVVGGASTGVVPAASVSTIFVLCTSMIQVFAGSQLKIIQ